MTAEMAELGPVPYGKIAARTGAAPYVRDSGGLRLTASAGVAALRVSVAE